MGRHHGAWYIDDAADASALDGPAGNAAALDGLAGDADGATPARDSGLNYYYYYYYYYQ